MTVKAVVVEDSQIAAEHVRRVLQASPQIEVVGTFASATDLLASDRLSAADVIVLDLLLPDRSGLSVVHELSQRAAVVIVSDSGRDSALVRESLAQGAVDFVAKRELATEAGRVRLQDTVREAATAGGAPPEHTVILVGSTGAVNPMERTARELHGLDASLVVLLHLPPDREQGLARGLAAVGWKARVARHGDVLRSGEALVAPGDRHLELSSSGRVMLTRAAPVGGHRPSATLLLRSAEALGRNVVAVVFSGMGRDGADAVCGLAEAGASVLAQDPVQCVAPSMPSTALAASTKVRRVPLPAIASTIRRAVLHDD